MLYYSLLGYQIFSSIWHQVAVTAFILTYPIFSPVNHHQERKRAHGDFEASCTSSLGGNFVKYMHVVFRHLWQKICMASFLVMGPILISLLLCWDACQQVRTGCPLIHAVESHTWTPKKKPGWYVYYIDRSDSYLCRIMVSLRMARRNLQGGRTPLLLERLHTCSHRPQSKCRIAIANCRNNTLVGIAKRLGCLSPFCTWQVLWSDGHFCVRVCVCACVYMRVIGSVISVSQVLDKMGSKKHVIYFVLVPRLRLHIAILRIIYIWKVRIMRNKLM